MKSIIKYPYIAQRAVTKTDINVEGTEKHCVFFALIAKTNLCNGSATVNVANIVDRRPGRNIISKKSFQNILM